jgi:hypothetical protein
LLGTLHDARWQNADGTEDSLSGSTSSVKSEDPVASFSLDPLVQDDPDLAEMMFQRRLRDSKSPEGDDAPGAYDPGSPLTDPEAASEGGGDVEMASVKAESPEATEADGEDAEEQEEEEGPPTRSKRKAPAKTTRKASGSKAEPAPKAAQPSKSKKATEAPAKKRKR